GFQVLGNGVHIAEVHHADGLDLGGAVLEAAEKRADPSIELLSLLGITLLGIAAAQGEQMALELADGLARRFLIRLVVGARRERKHTGGEHGYGETKRHGPSSALRECRTYLSGYPACGGGA